jgi:hypothetical protein
MNEDVSMMETQTIAPSDSESDNKDNDIKASEERVKQLMRAKAMKKSKKPTLESMTVDLSQDSDEDEVRVIHEDERPTKERIQNLRTNLSKTHIFQCTML